MSTDETSDQQAQAQEERLALRITESEQRSAEQRRAAADRAAQAAAIHAERAKEQAVQPPSLLEKAAEKSPIGLALGGLAAGALAGALIPKGRKSAKDNGNNGADKSQSPPPAQPSAGDRATNHADKTASVLGSLFDLSLMAAPKLLPLAFSLVETARNEKQRGE